MSVTLHVDETASSTPGVTPEGKPDAAYASLIGLKPAPLGRRAAAFAIDAGCLPSCVFKRVHLAMQNGAALLHTTVVAATKNAPVMHDHRSDRNATFSQS